MPSEATAGQTDLEKIFLGLTLEAQKEIPARLHQPKKRVIVLAGPTATGKTEFSLKLAKTMGGEVISADSMQIYKGMDIGTAKATPDQRAIIPHHMVDIRHVTESFNVVDFYFEARQCCQDILNREKIPIIVGGSGFYLHSILYGPPSGPPSVPEVRLKLEEELNKLGAEALFKRLKDLDPQYANTITKNDKQKIVRALEIMTLTGKKVSQLSWKSRLNPQNYDFRCWFLYRPREDLYNRIDDRCEEMMERGFIEEVRKLEAEGIRENNSASQAIGYRQALDYLESPQTEEDYQRIIRSFKQVSRNYVKRQFTWFRREPLFRWIDLQLHDDEVVMEMIRNDYEITTL